MKMFLIDSEREGEKNKFSFLGAEVYERGNDMEDHESRIHNLPRRRGRFVQSFSLCLCKYWNKSI